MNNDLIKGVVVNVLRENGSETEYLYLQRSGGIFEGQWWPVAGNCKENESPTDCAIRELKEETGLDVLQLFELGKEVVHIDQQTKLLGFVAYVSKTAQVRLNYEHSSYKWLNTQSAYELLPKIVHPYIEHIYDNFIKVTTNKVQCAPSA